MTHPAHKQSPSSGKPKRRWRLRLFLFVLALALLVPPATLLWFSRPAELAQLLAAWTRTSLDAQLVLGKEPSLGLWPNLHLELGAAEIIPRTADRAALQFSALRLVAPWSSLWSRELRLERIEMDAPKIDLDRFLPWIKGLSGNVDGPPTPIFLPEIGAPIAIHDGLLFRSLATAAAARESSSAATTDALDSSTRFDLDTTALAAGRPFRLNLVVHRTQGDYLIELATTPTLRDATLELADLKVSAIAPAESNWRLELGGSATLPSTQQIALNLAGTLHPATPTPATASTPPFAEQSVQLAFDGSLSGQGHLQLRYGRPEREFVSALQLGDMASWWQSLQFAESGLPVTLLPPATGTVSSAAIEISGVKLRGLELTIKPDEAVTEAPVETP